jgi:hypothetical protein
MRAKIIIMYVEGKITFYLCLVDFSVFSIKYICVSTRMLCGFKFFRYWCTKESHW